MGVEEILTLVNAGFTAEQIQAMVPQPEKKVEIKTEPEPEKKEEANSEDTKAEPENNDEGKSEDPDMEELKKELEEAKKQISGLQTLLGNQDSSGQNARQTPEEYLNNIFKNFY